MPPSARPVWGINHVLAYGQSLSTGWEGWPALSRRPRHDSLMLGASVRPLRENAPAFEPVDGPRLRPLAATVQRQADGALLDAEAQAALQPRDVAMGETVLEGALNHWRARMLENGARPGANLLLGSACGVGGRALEALMKGATPELFNRLRDCVRLGRQAAGGFGRSYGVAAVLLLQGEHNNWGIAGAVEDQHAYGALLARLRDDIAAELCPLAGQDAPPAMFLYQTGGAYAADAMGVPMAQLAFALHTPGVFLAAPVYPVSDKGGHLDANGYRWLGVQFGKVMHLVFDRGVDWKPLHPVAATLDGRTVRLRFHVPVPPLRFSPVLGAMRWRENGDQGFLAGDAAGEVGTTSVRLAGPDTVELDLARAPGPGLFVRYAGRTRHGGRGNLHDSDATRSDDVFDYPPGAHEAEAAAAAGLPGRPYPLMNWCVGFRLAVG